MGLFDFVIWLGSRMAGDSHRGSHNGRRARLIERGRRDYHDDHRERRGGSRSGSREGNRDDAPRRATPVCFGCNVAGHYQTDCWRFWTDPGTRRQMEADRYTCPVEFLRRQAVQSPPREGVQPRGAAIEPKAANRLDELGRTVASVQEFVEMERARRAERELRRCEREEARRAEEEALAAESEKTARKADKLRKKEEEQMAMAKAVEVQLSLRLGDIQEEIRMELRRASVGTIVNT
ncbi:hypothetical protein CBR_g50336 [Chara braunii]|uniref:CCHC-type domain-containing protein n=1 Tax=Chara braunii TaxID=69332 RepID=A0A388K5I2_CHABU|nr:hypothetical protein CBR_g50336 [Chara braunii]|eukprot:GBG65295.1 hypothetical protein CBR_g50336 [Chara braunii]